MKEKKVYVQSEYYCRSGKCINSDAPIVIPDKFPGPACFGIGQCSSICPAISSRSFVMVPVQTTTNSEPIITDVCELSEQCVHGMECPKRGEEMKNCDSFTESDSGGVDE